MTKKQTVQATKVKAIKKIWRTLEQDKTVIIVYGSAGAGKSYTTALWLIIKSLEWSNLHVLITRKTNPSLKMSALMLVRNYLDEMNIPSEYRVADQMIILPNHSVLFFRGMDDPEKIKSSEFNLIWMEEATEFSLEDYMQLKLRLRRERVGFKNKIILTFNPVPSWLKDYFFDFKREEDVAICKVTYKDNPFLNEEYKRVLEELANQSKEHYAIYALGEWAQLDTLVYNNYEIIELTQLPTEFDAVLYGVDFGYNNPTAVLRIGLRDDNVYVLDELYRTHLTNNELIDLLKTFVRERDAVLYCDNEPQRIEELRRAGFNAEPADKNVKMGIDFLKRRRIYILKHCVNTIKEIRTYSYKRDLKGNVTDEPLKFNDHTVDALRYAVYTYFKRTVPQIREL